MKTARPPLAVALLAPLVIGLLAPDTARANLDVVFLIDTTGSMSSEIREAKDRVKQIASALKKERAQERVRLGVVAFRDRGDAYVTKVSGLTGDVDGTFAFLAELRADGGGDGPEDVLSGVAASLREIEWDLSKDTERQVFLIGDAPAHLDYEGHFTTDQLVAQAREMRVVINSIGCRSLRGDGKKYFQQLAYATEGSYQHIGRVRVQGGGGGLAEAMLKSLARGGDALDMGDRLSTYVVGTGAPTAEVIVARLQRSDEGACTVEVSVPDGLGVAVEPHVRSGPNGLVVPLTLVPADGASYTLALPRCPAPGVAVHVTFGD
jgi:uncharacterized protein YegL